MSAKAVSEAVKKQLRKGENPSATIRKFFLDEQASHRENDAATIVKLCIDVVESDTSSKLAADVLSQAFGGVDKLKSDAVASVAQYLLELLQAGSLREGRSLELIPKLIARMHAAEVADANQLQTATPFKDYFLNKVCNTKWPARTVVKLADALRELDISQEQVRFIANKLVECLEIVEADSLPALVYQMLLLSTKGQRRTIVDGVLSFIDGVDDKHGADNLLSDSTAMATQDHSFDTELFQRAKGTILHHFVFASQQDHELGKQLATCFKDSTSLSPFRMALALGLAETQRMEGPMMTYLKTTIMTHFKDKHRLNKSPWLQKHAAVQQDLFATVVAVVKQSENGWEEVTAGLIALGLQLMDSLKTDIGAATSHLAQVCELGEAMVQETFKTHQAVRAEVIDQLLARIVSSSTTSKSHYLRVLERLCNGFTSVFVAHGARLRESLDYLHLVPSSTGIPLFKALLSVMRVDSSMREAAMIVLRKSLFHRNEDARMTACQGFLDLVDLYQSDPSDENRQLCFEILGTLRRTLAHQQSVRRTLYKGLERLVERDDLKSSVDELLRLQVSRIVLPGADALPPIKLDECLGSPGLKEPVAEALPELLTACQNISRTSQTATGNADEEDLAGMVLSVCKRMVKADMEDFELHKAADYTNTTDVGVRNRAKAEICLALYDFALNVVAKTESGANMELQQAQDLLTLQRKRQSLEEVLQEAKLKGSKPSQFKRYIELSTLCDLLRIVLLDDAEDTKATATALRAKPGFVKFLLHTAQILVKNHGEEESIEQLCRLFSYLWTEYVRGKDDSPISAVYDDKKEKGKLLRPLLLDICSDIVDAVFSHPREAWLRLAKALVESSADTTDLADEEEAIFSATAKVLQRLMIACLSDETRYREATVVTGMLHKFVAEGCFSSARIAKVATWVHGLCQQQQSIEDTTLIKALLGLLLVMDNMSPQKPRAAEALASDCHIHLGGIQEDAEEEDLIFAIAGSKAAETGTVPLLVLSSVDRGLDDIEWCIKLLAKSTKARSYGDGDSADSAQTLCAAVCDQLQAQIIVCGELSQTSMDKKNCWDALLKTTRRLYTLLGSFARHFVSRLSKDKEASLSEGFRELVDISGAELTKNIYATMTFINSAGDGESRSNAKAQKLKAVRDSRLMPSLVYAIEQYERYLIMLSKKTNVNLMRNMKRSTARDFRISAEEVQQAMAQAEAEVSADEDDLASAQDNSAASSKSQANDDGQVASDKGKKRKSSQAKATKRRKVKGKENNPASAAAADD